MPCSRRQQATAVVAARFKIVEGAVSMVEMALEQLSDKKIVDLDEEKKAAMVSNLMVVLCGDKDATPIVNTELYILNMSERKSIVLRIDSKKLRALEKWAADELRSTNAQIEYILAEALQKAGRFKGNRVERSQEGRGFRG